MSVSIIHPPQVLLFAVAADGERWVSTWAEDAPVPKYLTRGKRFASIMTAKPTERTLAIAVAWTRMACQEPVERPLATNGRPGATGATVSDHASLGAP